MAEYQKSLFIFRRDLRVVDNTALLAAVNNSKSVIPCFIFDPRQIAPHPYQSQTGLSFMLQALQDLAQQLAQMGAGLNIFHAAPADIVSRLIAEYGVDALFFNRDYSPFSRQRDFQLAEIAQSQGVAVHYLPDALLTEPEQALKPDQSPYHVFTPFYKNAAKFSVALPQALASANFIQLAESLSLDKVAAELSPKLNANYPGGRQAALHILENLSTYASYQENRDFPALAGTTCLSAHLKFGTCSVREVYHAIVRQLGSSHSLLRQLYWRDFFTHIAYHYPKVFGHAFIEKFDQIAWKNDTAEFERWRTGCTGFPIVDAGMRELNATGFMHNRVRMITASFLVKDLLISWRWGERYFAQKLLDYDPCVNNGNWQWAASTGCDAQPYFRIFNPWLQQQKFDPECHYIYRWIPELKPFSPKQIHAWEASPQPGEYPQPMLLHALASQRAKSLFKAQTSIEPLA